MADPNAKKNHDEVPDQVAGMANLMAHPLAGMAAASALGFGVASHAFGLWMGAISSLADASRRTHSDPSLDESRTHGDEPATGLRILSSRSTGEAAGAARTVKAKAQTTDPAAQARPARRSAASARSDDLKAISGIGPKLEQVLNARGITSYAQVAALSAADIAGLDDELGFGGRIQRDDWIGQAKSLASARKSGSKGAGRKRS